MAEAAGAVLGSVSVQINAPIQPLQRSLDMGEEAVRKFEASVNKFSNVIEGQFNKATVKGTAQVTKFNQGLQRTSAALGLMPGPAGAAAARVASLSVSMGSLGAAATVAGLGVGSVVAAMVKGVSVSQEFETLGLRTQAQLEATGYAAGLTAKEIRALAIEIGETSLTSAQDAERAAQVMLTFGNVSGDMFKEVLEAAKNLTAARGGGIESWARNISMAMEAPAASARRFRGILHRVVFEQAQDLMEAGKHAEAYRLILTSLTEGKTKGVALKETEGLAGAWNDVHTAAENFFLMVGDSGPRQGTEIFLDMMTTGLNRIVELSKSGAAEMAALHKSMRGPDTAKDLPFFNEESQRIAAKAAGVAAQATRAAQDAQADAIEKAREKRKEDAAEAERVRKKEAADLIALNLLRAETVAQAEAELNILKVKIPELLASGKLQEEVNTELQFELTLNRELKRLSLDRGSSEGQRLEAALRGQKDLNAEMERTLENRKEIEMSVEVTPMAKDPTKDAQQDVMIRFNQTVKDLNTELLIQQETLGMTRAEAEAYRFEQEALADVMAKVGFVSDDQAASIKELAGEYKIAADALETLRGKQEATAFLNEELERNFEDVVFGMKSLGQAAEDMGHQLAKAVVQALAFGQGPMAGLFGTTAAPGGAGQGATGGIAGTAVSLISSFLHEGGVVGRAGSRRPVPIRAFIGAPRLHNGLRPDEMPAILQRGETVLSRRDSQQSKGGGASYTWNVQTPDISSFMKSKRQLASQAKRTLEGKPQ